MTLNPFQNQRDFASMNNAWWGDILKNWWVLDPMTNVQQQSIDTLQKRRKRKTAMQTAESIAKQSISDRAKDKALKTMLKKMDLKKAAKKWLKAIL